MAEFMNKPRRHDRKNPVKGDSGFAAFGKDVPMYRRSEALRHIREMGIKNNDAAWECIGKMSDAIARDKPYEAMQVGMEYVDLTGTYRLMAVLCAGVPDGPR